MQLIAFNVQRISYTSQQSFEETVEKLSWAIGRPDMQKFQQSLTRAWNVAEVEEMVRCATGCSGLMEFARYDAGELIRKKSGKSDPRIMRFLIGNPVTLENLAESAPHAAAYAPVTILVHQSPFGVHLTYDLMESYIAPYQSPQALEAARDLDVKIMRLLEHVSMK